MNDERLIYNIEKARQKEQITLYFAHTLKLRDKAAKTIIPTLENRGFKVINPFNKRLKELSKFGEDEEAIRKALKSPPRWIVMHDLADINECDAVIVFNPTGASYGSTLEAAYAWMVRQIPVFFIVQEKYLFHPWIGFVGHSIITEDNLNTLYDKIDQLFQIERR